MCTSMIPLRKEIDSRPAVRIEPRTCEVSLCFCVSCVCGGCVRVCRAFVDISCACNGTLTKRPDGTLGTLTAAAAVSSL